MHDPARPDLSALGWDADLAAAFALFADSGVPARITRSDRGGMSIVDTGTRTCRVRLPQRLRRPEDPTSVPTVGDWVVVGEERLEGDPVIAAVLPRRSAFIRQAPADRSADAQILAANVDTAMVVAALDGPTRQARLDRFLALAWTSGAVPAIVLTKADRCADVPAVLAEVEAAAIGVPVHPLSAVTGEGLGALEPYLRPGRTAVLLGPSGVGKSTLANRLLGTETLETQGVREDGRGRHTTTHRQLLRLPSGGLLIDTPGLRELGLWDADEGISEVFGDIEELAAACRFSDCKHDAEPGCAVTAAAAEGRLDPDRLASYRKLERELAHLARKQDARLRKAEQGRWKQINRDLRATSKNRDR